MKPNLGWGGGGYEGRTEVLLLRASEFPATALYKRVKGGDFLH